MAIDTTVSKSGIDTSFIGKSGETRESSWNSDKALLYAVAVGAGLEDPSQELEFTTENSPGINQKVLPSFVCVSAGAPLPEGLEIDFRKLLHAEQSFHLTRPLPVEGTVTAVNTVTGMYDKGSGALITTETIVKDENGDELARIGSGLFLRGEGGFGGERGQSDSWTLPDRAPDAEVPFQTRPEQALLYRLTGDRNPLHSSPEFAKMAGFGEPILHGMCTYGFTARVLLHEVAGSDPEKFAGMYGRFSKTVLPGEPLVVQIWKLEDGGALFRTINADGDAVIDRGRVETR